MEALSGSGAQCHPKATPRTSQDPRRNPMLGPVADPSGLEDRPKSTQRRCKRQILFFQNERGASARSTFWPFPGRSMTLKNTPEPILRVYEGAREGLGGCAPMKAPERHQEPPKNPPRTPQEPHVGACFGPDRPQKTAQSQRNEGPNAKHSFFKMRTAPQRETHFGLFRA